MRSFMPRLSALAVVLVLGLCGRGSAQGGELDVQKDVTVYRFVTDSPELDHQAAALALEELVALKLKRSRLCNVTDKDTFVGDAASYELPLTSELEVREAMVALDMTYLVTGTVRAQGPQVNVSATLFWGERGRRAASALATITVPGMTTDLQGLCTSVALSVLREMRLPVSDEAEARVGAATLSENEHALRVYFQGRAMLAGTTLEDCDRAAGDFQQAIQLDERFREARIALGDVYSKKADVYLAAGDKNTALQELGSAAGAYALIGEGYRYSDVQTKAAGLYRDLGDNVSKVKCYHHAVEALLVAKRPHALRDAEGILTLIGVDEQTAHTKYLFGRIYRADAQRMPETEENRETRIETLRRAAVYYEEAKEMVLGADDALETKILIETGEFYRNVGKEVFQDHLERSMTDLLRATVLSPDNWEVWYQLGLTYTDALAFEQAVSAFRRALPLIPENRPMLLSLVLEGIGRAYFLQESFEQAVVVLEEALRHEPFNVNAAVFLVIAYARLGQFDLARERLRETIDRFPVVPNQLLNLEQVINMWEERANDALDAPTPQRGDNTNDPGRFGGGYDRLEEIERERDAEREREEREEAGRR